MWCHNYDAVFSDSLFRNYVCPLNRLLMRLLPWQFTGWRVICSCMLKPNFYCPWILFFSIFNSAFSHVELCSGLFRILVQFIWFDLNLAIVLSFDKAVLVPSQTNWEAIHLWWESLTLAITRFKVSAALQMNWGLTLSSNKIHSLLLGGFRL